jgi:hypothetical protein
MIIQIYIDSSLTATYIKVGFNSYKRRFIAVLLSLAIQCQKLTTGLIISHDISILCLNILIGHPYPQC